jgi:predicted nucleic acid-binding protein
MPFVLDASVTASWAFPNETDSIAVRAGELLESASDHAIVPALWWYEVRNMLVINERRGRTVVSRSTIFLEQIAQLPIQIDTQFDSAIVMDLARTHHLTVYDAAYLSLAIREALPLATLDKQLGAAAATLKIPLLS